MTFRRKRLPPTRPRTTLEAFARAVEREAYVLLERPDLIWQQLYNRLQWEGEPMLQLLAPELARRSVSGATPPWLRTRTPFRESGTLVRTLAAGGVNACAISSDGTFIVSGGYEPSEGVEYETLEGILKIWDVVSGRELAVLRGHTGPVTTCAVSPDGSFIVSGSLDNTLKIWDAMTGAERFTLTGHTGEVTACTISPDGSLIVSAGQELTERDTSYDDRYGILRIWDAVTGKARAILRGHTSHVTTCAVSSDGSFIVSGSEDNTLKIWDDSSGEERATLRGRGFTGCAISADSTVIVSSGDRGLIVWDVPRRRNDRFSLLVKRWADRVLEGLDWTSSRLYQLEDWSSSPLWQIRTLDWFSRLFSKIEGGLRQPARHLTDRVTSWEQSRGRRRTLNIGRLIGFALSPDGSFVVSLGGLDKTLKIWDIRKGIQRATLRGHSSDIKACAVSRDGSLIVSASRDNTVKIWKTPARKSSRREILYRRSKRKRPTLWVGTQGGSDQAYGSGDAFAISPDGSFIVSTGGPGLQVWDTASGVQRTTLRVDEILGFCCAISPDGSFIVSVCESCGKDDFKELMILELKSWKGTGAQKGSILAGHSDMVSSCKISLDGSFIVSASLDKTLKIWDVASGQKRATLRGHTSFINDCAISPDATFIVSASDDKTLKLWNTAKRSRPATLKGHTDKVTACAISPDGSFMVSASEDGTLKIWDVARRKERATLSGHASSVTACAISADGSFVVSGGTDGTLRFWDATSRAERATLFLPISFTRVALHPRQPIAICGDEGGAIYRVDLIGINYAGPPRSW